MMNVEEGFSDGLNWFLYVGLIFRGQIALCTNVIAFFFRITFGNNIIPSIKLKACVLLFNRPTYFYGKDSKNVFVDQQGAKI